VQLGRVAVHLRRHELHHLRVVAEQHAGERVERGADELVDVRFAVRVPLALRPALRPRQDEVEPDPERTLEERRAGDALCLRCDEHGPLP
jgi:hypothetical protein